MVKSGGGGGCGGCFMGLLSVVAWWVLLGSFGVIVLLVHSEPDLRELEGLGKVSSVGEVVGISRKLAAARASRETLISEKELNGYLAATVRGAQSERVSKWISFEVVGVDFKAGSCEVFLVRNFMKRRSVVSVRLVMEEREETRFFRFRGGSAGVLPLPGGLAMIGGNAFERLHQVLENEIESILGCRQIEFRDGELRLMGYEEE